MPHRPPLGLFDNEVRLYSLDELTETVRLLERSQPGRAAAELSNAVFAELAMKRSRRAVELVAEAIRRARSREPREDIGGSRWQAGTAEVRAWALRAGYEIPADGAIPEHAIAAYNQTHPDRPYGHSADKRGPATDVLPARQGVAAIGRNVSAETFGGVRVWEPYGRQLRSAGRL